MKKVRTNLPIRVGIFERMPDADLAVQRLVDAGIPADLITVVCAERHAGRHPGVHEEGPAGSHAPAAAVRGGAIGALLGGLVAVAGIGLSGGLALVAAGPLFLGGGAVAGGFIGAMLTRGVEHEVANFCDQALERGRILVAVDAHGREAGGLLARAERVFEELGAHPIALREG